MIQKTVMDALNSASQTIRDGLLKNPLAWLLLAAFLIAEYGNYQRGKELQRICDLLEIDAAATAPGTAADEIANICTARDDPYED
jgi:hypothetical protein